MPYFTCISFKTNFGGKNALKFCLRRNLGFKLILRLHHLEICMSHGQKRNGLINKSCLAILQRERDGFFSFTGDIYSGTMVRGCRVHCLQFNSYCFYMWCQKLWEDNLFPLSLKYPLAKIHQSSLS